MLTDIYRVSLKYLKFEQEKEQISRISLAIFERFLHLKVLPNNKFAVCPSVRV